MLIVVVVVVVVFVLAKASLSLSRMLLFERTRESSESHANVILFSVDTNVWESEREAKLNISLDAMMPLECARFEFTYSRVMHFITLDRYYTSPSSRLSIVKCHKCSLLLFDACQLDPLVDVHGAA